MSLECSPDQMLNIATYFCMSAPPAQIDEVVADVTKLVNDDVTLNSDNLTAILREYNTDQMTVASDANGKQVLITKFGQVGPNLYLDPSTGHVLEFDHLTRTIVTETDKRQVLNESTDAFRQSINQQLTAYLQDTYKPGKAVEAVYGADNGIITICISARNVNLNNFWSGSWRSIYSININNNETTELKGQVKVVVHYFEDGNVQLHAEYPTSQHIEIDSSSPAAIEDTCKSIVESIRQSETNFQNELEEMYVEMHTKSFKAMRRFLPVSRQKFTWNAAAHSLASEVVK